MTATTKLLITGVTKNSASFISEEVRRIEDAAATIFEDTEWFVVESDSSDNTSDSLKILQAGKDNFYFVSLGVLSDKYPMRTHRIAFCRNKYIEYIRESKKIFDYVLVVDLDRLNTKLSASSLESCFQCSEWSGCFANQTGPYYDIWALRHSEWSPNDCLAQRDFFEFAGLSRHYAAKAAIHDKMITLSSELPWIEVESAFGGAALYRSEVFQYAWYSGNGDFRGEICEHVPFNRQLVEHGFKLFINPRFINADYTEHTRNLKFSRKIAVRLKRILIQAIKSSRNISRRISAGGQSK